MLLAKIEGDKIVDVINVEGGSVGGYVEIPEDLPADADLRLYDKNFRPKSLELLKEEGLAVVSLGESFFAVSLEDFGRGLRDSLLLQVDSIAGNPLRWEDLLEEGRAEISKYRTLLLDVPQQKGFPNRIEWPEIPPQIKGV